MLTGTQTTEKLTCKIKKNANNCNAIPEAPPGIYATDECLCACVVLVEETALAPGCPFGQVIVRSWRATDRCGNVTIVTQNITLTDDEGPVITGVRDTACINDPNLYEVVATDQCGGSTVLVFQDINIPNPCGSGVAIRRTYEAYDACGNVARDTAILLLNDQNQLNLVFLNAALAALDSGEVLTLEYAPAHTNGHYTSFGVNDVVLEDACLSGGFVSFTERILEIGDCTVDGFMVLIELKWTATDVCGNETELTVIARMIDETSPVFVNFIPEMTIGCDETLPEIFSNDNSNGTVIMTTRDTTIRGDCPFEYDLYREITLRDSCGNSATRLQIIHVRDNRGPIIQGVEEEVCDDLSIPVVTAYDVCAETFVAVTMEADTLDVPCNGLSVIRTWTAVGICGHVTQIRQTITMNDHTPPEIIIPAGSVILPFLDNDHNVVPSSQVYVIENLNDLNEHSVLIRDDCDQDIIPVLTIKVTFAEDCEAEGYYERRTYTWMATDACGNMSVFTFSVDIMDDLPPGFSETLADVTIICAPLPPAPEVHAVDLAQPGTVTYSETIVPGGSPGEFIVTRTWVATDACGNTATYVQHITWIPDTFLECAIILPESVECNTHGVVISSEVTGGLGPITYNWQIVGEKCFIQGGQGTSEIIIYVGWSTVKIILTVTDAYGCASMCMILLPCVPSTGDLSIDLPAAAIIETGNPHTGTPTSELGIAHRVNENLEQVKLWPNPASESVTLSFQSAIEEEVAFSFINTLGQVVLSDKIKAHVGLNTFKIDASQTSNGTHLVQLKTEREIHTEVIVIMRNP
ncbi:MAG: T9SS type A sorting domain-containing protein [Saprospiraceae bacterium]|nr:T9SS type A sorting domain-containing protein [Saprospiraceae bacterium]